MNVPRVHLEPELGDRRQLILAAAVQEFAEHGREGASTNRIARKAQVAKGLIFRYFTSKEGLFDAALDHACEHLFAPPRGALPADPFQRLEEFVVLRARAIEAHPVLARFIAQFRGRSRLVASKATRRVDRAYDNLRAIFKEGVQIEVFRRGWDFAAALELLSLVAEALEERFLVAVQQAGENEGEIASILDAKGVRERVRRFTEILKWGSLPAGGCLPSSTAARLEAGSLYRPVGWISPCGRRGRPPARADLADGPGALCRARL